MVLGGIALGLAGCSVLYDPDQLAARDGGLDADADRDADIDASAGVRVLAQTELVEGLGCDMSECTTPCTAMGCPFGNSAGLVLIEIPAGTTLASATGSVAATHPAVVEIVGTSSDQRQVALAVRIPVSALLPAGDHQLALALTLDDQRQATVMLPAVGLPELLLTSGPAGPFAPRYSIITVPPGATPMFTTPVRLRATSDLLLGGTLSVAATTTGPGPGGCAGAATDATPRGDCGIGGGVSVADSSGDDGGAGSFGTIGGGNPALAGGVTGNPYLVPLGASGNTGNGGGAHGASSGGHGGGVIELSTTGQIYMSANRITADGGAPAPGTRTGGGGSGGAILLRAAARFRIEGPPRRVLSAEGGGSTVRGGLGRIRVDAAVDLPGLAGTSSVPDPYRGVMAAVRPLVAPATSSIMVRAQPDALALLRVDGAPAGTCMAAADGLCAVTIMMTAGLHNVCAQQASVTGCELPESCNCFDVVVLP